MAKFFKPALFEMEFEYVIKIATLFISFFGTVVRNGENKKYEMKIFHFQGP